MPPSISAEQLDQLLSLQLVLAWAGETPGGDQPRLGWWRTDLIDADGGGSLWARLLPRTHLWAGLDAARRAARQVDAAARQPHARADDLVTLFHFGFAIDEALDEQLAHHKLEAKPPREVLPLLALIEAPLNREALLAKLHRDGLDLDFKVTPVGRQLAASDGEDRATEARRLACAMLTDPPRHYPLPFMVPEAPRARR